MHKSRHTRTRIDDSSWHPNRFGLTWIEWIVMLAIIGVMVALLLPAQRGSRPATRRMQCKNNLKQIGLALYNYHDAFGSFPPPYTVDADGHRLHSWRTLILPYAEQKPLYDTIDLSKPWDDPENSEAFEKSLEVYRCPSGMDLKDNFTTYLALVREDAAFHPDRSRALSEFADPSRTAIVVDVPVAESVHWMSPQDTDPAILNNLSKETFTSHTDGTHILMADGSVVWVNEETPSEELREFQTISND